MSQILDSTGDRPPLRTRVAVRLCVGVARGMAHLAPRRIVRLLTVLRRGARPATVDEALRARRDVTDTSTMCSGRYCLQRALATTLLCRLRGRWPTWCSGVRTPPFNAHAWVEVEGVRVGEPEDSSTYHTMLSVPPRTPQAPERREV